MLPPRDRRVARREIPASPPNSPSPGSVWISRTLDTLPPYRAGKPPDRSSARWIMSPLKIEKNPPRCVGLNTGIPSRRIRFWSADPPRTLKADEKSETVVTPGSTSTARRGSASTRPGMPLIYTPRELPDREPSLVFEPNPFSAPLSFNRDPLQLHRSGPEGEIRDHSLTFGNPHLPGGRLESQAAHHQAVGTRGNGFNMVVPKIVRLCAREHRLRTRRVEKHQYPWCRCTVLPTDPPLHGSWDHFLARGS